MEQNLNTRKVTIINSRTQSQKVIQDSKATTLGELKAEMRERGIDYSGMTFFEGHMRAELKDDAAPLPTNIPYKGQVVNDLTFMLTAPEKKVKSGAMSRAEAYNSIKAFGLQDECKKKFGKNFTQCSTADLISLIEKNLSSKPAPKVKETKEEVKQEVKESASEEAPKDAPVTTSNGNFEKAFVALLDGLYNDDTINEETYDKCKTLLSGGTYTAPEKMSKKEVDEMFNFVER